MKTKTYTTLALALAVSGCAWATEVVSSNVVGYSKISLNSGLNLLSAQFVPVDAEEGDTLALADLTNISGQSGYAGSNPQTEIRYWTGSGYTKYGWSGNFSTDNARVAQQMVQRGTIANITDLDNKWLSGYSDASDVPANLAEGFWVYASNSGEICVSGEVPSTESSVTVDLAAGLNLLSYPWPIDCKLKAISVTGQPGYSGATPQTEIRVWTGAGYTKYGWAGNFSTDNARVAQQMVQRGTIANITDLDNKWLSGYSDASNVAIPAGYGFWIYAKSAGSVTFTFTK